MKKRFFRLGICTLLVCGVCVAVLIASRQSASLPTESSSAADGEPVQVLIDVEFATQLIASDLSRELGRYTTQDGRPVSLKKVIEQLGGPTVELVIAPIDREERDMFLTRLKTEIMAGGGPDVFVCVSGGGFRPQIVEPGDTGALDEDLFLDGLFRFPQQAMERGMFMNLDKYLPSARFLDWNKLDPTVMAAGRSDQYGQCLLPMAYTLWATLYKAAEIDGETGQATTWADELSMGPAFKEAAVHVGSLETAALEPFVDEDGNALGFSADDLVNYFEQKRQAQRELTREELPTHAGGPLRIRPLSSYSGFSVEDQDEAFRYVPVYSRGGGATATVLAFVGVNANTRQPENAFFVADYLLGLECQQSVLYNFIVNDTGLPTMDEAFAGADASGAYTGRMPETLYQAVCDLREEITSVQFETPLDWEMTCLEARLADADESAREGLIRDAYARMSLMVGES